MTSPNRGRRGRRWEALKANQRAKRHACWICGQPIRYDLDWPDPDSFTVDHEPPLSIYPAGAEDPACLRSAHARCNSSKGNRKARPALGNTSRTW